MKTETWMISDYGMAGLRRSETALPTPMGRQVRVRVEAVALNYRDLLMLENGMGGSLAFPFVPSSDMSGTVEAIGPDVTQLAPGDRVVSAFYPEWQSGQVPGSARQPLRDAPGGSLPGLLARHVVMDEAALVAAPATLDPAEASTLPCAGLTAWSALIAKAGLRAGERVLIHGTGGVALFALLLAKLHGAETFITSGSEEKRARAVALGADHALPREAWLETVLDLTHGRGVEHVIETIGGDHLGLSLQAAAPAGRISMIGVIGGFTLAGSLGPLLTKELVLQGITVGHKAGLAELIRAVDRTGLKPVIDRRYGFDAVPQALAHLARGAFGKVVIDLSTS